MQISTQHQIGNQGDSDRRQIAPKTKFQILNNKGTSNLINGMVREVRGWFSQQAYIWHNVSPHANINWR